ncbi:hypothetical protein EW026_g2781 [Hermanssonia centrifuga]|uniref:Condensin complex subunit 1 n=1 Tax=Hermanssonia centrifuga TaxID=98765 RepID=A0A4V3XAW0_9APHY|nr:hypothetical protein EW026_g2781 [Hermanssonia centrifuga]
MAEFDLQEHIQSLQDVANYEIPQEHDVSAMDPRAVAGLLQAAVVALAESPDAITDPAVFDAYRSLLKHAESLQGSTMSKLLDSISSAFQAQVEATIRDLEEEDQQTFMAHKSPLEMYAFLLHWFVSAAEKVKATGEEDAPAPPTRGRRGRGGKSAAASRAKKTEGWTWTEHIPGTLGLISKVLRLKTQRIWTTTAERDTFINCLTGPAYRVTENEGYMKVSAIRLSVYKVICLAVKQHGHTLAAQITIMQSLQYYEHLSEPMAECLAILAKEFDHVQLCDEVLREIAGKAFSAQDSKGPRAFSKFLVRLAELSPRSVLKQISLLLAHLDSESYPMRMALVEVLGNLIREIAVSSDLTADAQQTTRQLNGLYDLLLERTLDLSSYVRTKVLTTLARLCDLPVKFPKQRLAITRAAVDSLEDKAAGVRKSSVALIVKLVVTHPYGLMHGGLLGLGEWEERYKTVCDQLAQVEGVVGKAVERERSEEEDEEGEEEGDGDEEDEERSAGPSRKRKSKRHRENDDEMEIDGEEQDEEGDEDEDEDEDVEMQNGDEEGAEPRTPKKKKKSKKPRRSEFNMEALANEQAAVAALEGEEMMHLRLRKRYYAEALSFIRQIENGMKVIEELLASTNKPEVLESMEFFRVAHEYQFDSAEVGIKKMLHLIWHKDHSSTSEDGKELKGVRPRLLECYRNLYFDPLPDMEPKQQVNRIAKNMIELTYDATLAELTSLEEMMRIMMEDGQIHSDVIGKLWQVYSSERPLPRAQRRGTVIILGMLALARRSVVADRVDTLVKIGLGSRGRVDLTLAKYTCVALQRLNGSAKKVKGSLMDKNIRHETDNPLFKKLQEAIEHPCRSKDWFGMAEQAINTVYALAERPDIFCDSLIKNFTRRAFEPKKVKTSTKPVEKDPEAMDEDDNPEAADISGSQDAVDDKDTGDAFELSQLLFVVGHVAIKQIVFLELAEREWKRQKHEKELAEKAAAGRNSDNPAQASKDNGEELDQVAGNAEDEIGERIAGMRETELLYGEESLLTIYGPLIVHICGSPHKFKNRTLRAAATLAFSKFLCVSSQFCDQHHRLLFKILETSKDASIRSNIVIALGDVAVSFSNIIDENSNELYKGLSDKDLVVKKNTLMVLTHLILNGMIKVKGQLGEMAKCLEDEDERIADLAKLFFSELSTKDNAIYNNLPDVISHLSVGAHSVDEETFQSTMKYIFTFIEKARQNKSQNKPDAELNEFEGILEEHRRQGAEDQAFEKRVEGKKAAAKKRATRRSARKKAPQPEDSD